MHHLTTEPLKCPLQSPINIKTEAYRSFLANVEQFRALNALPTAIYFLNESAASFQHCASWHESCYLKYNNSKLKKAEKRKRSACMDESERTPCKRQAMNIDICLFCEKGYEEGDLHQVLTFDANTNI